ncbi:MAG: alpha/beta fold hydrolase [Planctomycetota bacterium]
MSWHPAGRYLSIGAGRQVHVVDVGQGPVVLLVHGFLHSAWTWRHTIEGLAPRYRVIAPDLLGFGKSDAGGQGADHSLPALKSWVVAVLRALGVERLALACGNSLGGAIALDLALARTLPVERLALSNPYLLPLPLPSLPLRLLGLQPFAPLFRATAGNPGFVRWALNATAYHREVDGDVLEGFRHLERPGSHRATCETARHLAAGVRELGTRLRAAPPRAPTVVAWGQRDRLLLPGYGRRVAGLLPDARFVPFAASGHCPQEEEPEAFLALLEELLA